MVRLRCFFALAHDPSKGFGESLSAQVPMGENGEIDVGCGNAFAGNSSEDALPDGVELVCDVVETYHLQQCDMSKKEFKEYLMVRSSPLCCSYLLHAGDRCS